MGNLLKCEPSQALFPRTQLTKRYQVETKMGTTRQAPSLGSLAKAGEVQRKMSSVGLPSTRQANPKISGCISTSRQGSIPSPHSAQDLVRDSPSVPRNTKLAFYARLLWGLWVGAASLSPCAPAMSGRSNKHLSPSETVTAPDLCSETILERIVF